MQKRILILSVIVNVFFLILFGIHVQEGVGFSYLIEKLGFKSWLRASNPNRTGKYKYYNEKESLFEILPKENDEIIFIGSSLIDGCEWSELFQNPKIKNRGIGGDNVAGILRRIDKALESRPKKIFVSIGNNDLSMNVPIEIIINDTKQIFDRIRRTSPMTQVYVQSILPINDKFYIGKDSNEQIKTLNTKLKNICDDKQTIYIDLYSPFLNSEKSLDEKYSTDGIHLMGDGYLVWKSVIEKYVN